MPSLVLQSLERDPAYYESQGAEEQTHILRQWTTPGHLCSELDAESSWLAPADISYIWEHKVGPQTSLEK
jgi:hypothetical protein